MTDLDALRYPVGRFQARPSLSPADRDALIAEIARLPGQVRDVAKGLSEAQLDSEYRPGGWTARQVVHHIPDSHLNAYVRMKLALTEDSPAVKPYDEAAWAETMEARVAPLDASLDLLDALHRRWVLLLRSLGEKDFARTVQHPEAGLLSLDALLQIYAWHGRHHLGHLRLVAEAGR